MEVECDIANGMPAFNIVGLGDTSVQESRERVRSSVRNSGFIFPPTRKTINLAPARIRKHGAMFDLPIAVGILAASKQLALDGLDGAIVVGELSLNATVKSVPGAMLITQAAREQGFKKIFLPAENAVEASYIKGIKVYPVENLRQLTAHLQGKEALKSIRKNKIPRPHRALRSFPIIGMAQAKRALAIAAAGGHNVLLSGSPGCGKTVICRAFKQLQTEMSEEEVIESSKIYSISGNLDPDFPLVTERPFREVHHSITLSAMIGGGPNSRPGEISLAHNGTLFLDEIAEFPRKVLESLRQPLEDKVIHITRSRHTSKFPCDFTLLATMNPCPCGYHGDPKVKCICSDHQINSYQKKLSGPLLDRFDIFLEVAKTPIQELLTPTDKPENIIAKIDRAHQIRSQRGPTVPSKHLDRASQKTLKLASKSLNLSNRAYFKVLNLARTIADLENSERIKELHIMEALQYRKR